MFRNCSVFVLSAVIGSLLFPRNIQAQGSMSFCECVLDPSGAHLILVAVSEVNGTERWRKILETFPPSNTALSTCKDKLSLARYCVR